jgi:branched-chain amino acid transport system permease protein
MGDEELARRKVRRGKRVIKSGLVAGGVAVLVSLIGMVEAFGQRYIVADIISIGHALLLGIGVLAGYLVARESRSGLAFLGAVGAGGIAGAVLCLLVVVGNLIPLRRVFINASPVLFELLTLGQGNWGIGILVLLGCGSAAWGGAMAVFPQKYRKAAINAMGWVVTLGVLQVLVRPLLAAWGPVADFSELVFEANGLTVEGALGTMVAVALGTLFWRGKGERFREAMQGLNPATRKALRVGWVALVLAILLVLPQILGLFLSEVLTVVGLYVLLGLGLNIVVGFAGLLDLGYVAFFAIGSYTVAVLTSPELGFFNLTFWEALPVAIALGVVSGVLLGIPVLKMRGDYLAIATLGFGEIIRILVLSDFLRPWLGGAQGIGKIPKASIGGFEFATPQELYYLILAGCALVGVISWRLRDSRIGRAWMAIREDEDVAQAMGINLVAMKLLAFATGAAFSALSGAIFATKLGSVYPHSFNVMISINILCLIIVGGMGSIPGVIVGAAALVGLPELLREFAEYRLLVYGAALVAMMLLKPEGLWPEAVRKRELHFDSATHEMRFSEERGHEAP